MIPGARIKNLEALSVKLGVDSNTDHLPSALPGTVKFLISSNSSAGPQSDSAPDYPEDSIINDLMGFLRDFSEAHDTLLVGASVSLAAACMARRAHMPFAGGMLYPNLFCMLVAFAGDGKSTAINPVEKIARFAFGQQDRLMKGSMSVEAMFERYLVHPDKFWIQDEGNTMLKHWADSAPGQAVSKQMLELHDCRRWEQSYMRQAKDDESPVRIIEETSTSMLLGATPNICRLKGVDSKDGLERRFTYYFSEHEGRSIVFPKTPPTETYKRMALKFGDLFEVRGEFKGLESDRKTKTIYERIKHTSDARRTAHDPMTPDGEARRSYERTVCSKIIKLAMIFESARWAKTKRGIPPNSISAESLSLAESHVLKTIMSFDLMQTLGRKAELTDEGDTMMARIRREFTANRRGNAIWLTKTDLTYAFAKNSGRSGSRSTTDIYLRFIPALERRGLAKLHGRIADREWFAFLAE